MSAEDRFKDLLELMRKEFVYLPKVPNIIASLNTLVQYTMLKGRILNNIYPAIEKVHPQFDRVKYEEAAKNAYFSKLDFLFDVDNNEFSIDSVMEYSTILNSRANYIHDQYNANKEELSGNLGFIVDMLETAYTTARFLHTYAFSLFGYQVYIDKDLDVSKTHKEYDEFISAGFHIINYMFKANYMYKEGEFLYGRELADDYIKDMYTDNSDEGKVLIKEALSFCFEKGYISEEIHSNILDIFQNADSGEKNVVFN